MIFNKKKRSNTTTTLEVCELDPDICVLSLEECLKFVTKAQNIIHFTSPHRKQKELRLDLDSYQLIFKGGGSISKQDVIQCERIKEVRYATECFGLLKLEDVQLELCITIKFKIPNAFLWGTFSFEAFDEEAAQRWVHTLRLLQRSNLHKRYPGREKEIFINRVPYFLQVAADNREMEVKDLKVFLCNMCNYNIDTVDLNDIMEELNIDESSPISLDHLRSIYDKLAYNPKVVSEYFDSKSIEENGSDKSRSFPLFSEDTVTSSEMAEFLELHDSTLSPPNIINKYGCNEEMTREQFLEFLYSDENSIFERSTKVEDLMDSPMCHYWVASSHNTFLTGNQLKSKSSVEAYVQALLSGCKCIELDLWERQGTIMILHGYTLTSMVEADEVLAVIDMYAFRVSPYPVILSVENHLGNSMQEKFAKMLKERFKDKLLTAPLNDGGVLPSPVMLMNKIIIKDKKRMKDELEPSHYNQDIVKNGEIYFETALHANDWTKRMVFMTTDFLYYSYFSQDADDYRTLANFSTESENTPRITDLHHSEPWFWGTVDPQAATHYVSEYIVNMKKQNGNDVKLTGDFAIRPSSQFPGENVLIFLDCNNSPKKIKIKSRSEEGHPRYSIEEYVDAPTFDTLYALVKHYQRIPFSVKGVPLILRNSIEEPRNFEKEIWFHYNASLEDSEKRLACVKRDGAFLVREQPDNNFRLVFRCSGAIKQCRLRQDGRLWIIGKSHFDGLTKLVEYYKKYPLYCTRNNQQIKLTEPVKKIPVDDVNISTYLTTSYITCEDIKSQKPQEAYIATEDYKGKSDGEMTFLEGAILKNVERDHIHLGWCIGDYGPRKQRYIPYKLLQPYEWEDEENKDNPLGNMCAGMIQLKNSIPRIHKVSDDPCKPHFISIRCEGKEEYRLGFDHYETMEAWFFALSNAKKPKQRSLKGSKLKQNPVYANLVIYAQSKPAPNELTDDHIQHISYKEMHSVDENKLLTYTKKPTYLNVIKCTNKCMLRVYPKGTRTASSNFDPLTSWNYGCQLVALNYQTPDKPMQLNFGKFSLCNGGCGYVRKPEDMISGQFDPSKDTFPNSIALFITVISGRMLSSEEGNLPKVKISLEGLDCDPGEEVTRPSKSSLAPFWNEKLGLLSLNPDMAMIRFEVTDSNDFGDDKFIGHCTFPVKMLKTGFRSVPLFDGYGDRIPMASLLVYTEKEKLKPDDPERELHRIRREILQLNEYLSELTAPTQYDIDRLSAIENKYFTLKDKIKLDDIANSIYELDELVRNWKFSFDAKKSIKRSQVSVCE